MRDNNSQIELNQRIIEAKDTLSRIDLWISNCDTKAGIVLALFGVLISVFMSSFDFEYLFSFFSSIKSHFSIWSLLYLAVLISSVIFMGFGIINLILSLFARINPLIYQEERLVTDSVVFFGTIAGNKTFDAFSAKFDNCDKAKYLRDIQSQIYINSSIATAKFSYYNKGIKCSFTGFVIVAFILLVIRFAI